MRWGYWLCAFVIWVFAQPALAAPSDFPRPVELEPQVVFWKNIFVKYSEHQAVVHDDLLMDKVHRVLDFRPLHNSGVSQGTYWRKRKAAERAAVTELRAMFNKIQRVGGDKSQLNAEERRFRDRYAAYTSATKWSNAASRVRVQGGLKERFRKAIIISGSYMPYMENVFRSHGLPIELTRLPYVESSFNLHAYSSVAAAGIWQFMPESGRIYNLRQNDVVDDRRDPWFSTHAAARHLKDDYARLKDWGLAVTAYNHGRAGVARAVREVNGTGIQHVVKQYQGRRFGFASRNFYASFVAAMDVAGDYERYFGKLQKESPILFDEVKTEHYVDFGTLASLAGTTVAEFSELNPAFHSVVKNGNLRVPPNYSLRVPKGRSASFYQQYAALGPGTRFTTQKSYYVHHKVQRGDSLSVIARRYGSSVNTIMRTNNLRSAHQLRVGQVLKIPSQQTASASRSVYAGKAASSTGGGYRVRPGDTLSQIAARHGTSVSALMQANNLSNPKALKVGQTLSIPGGSSSTVAAAGASYTVKSGDVLSKIAQQHGVTVSSLMAANNLTSAHRLRVGQTLKIPAGGSARVSSIIYTVQPGDALSTIAARHNVNMRTIMQENNLDSVHRLSVGQRLTIPGASPAQPLYVSHKVQRGQTLSAIARRYGTTVRTIQRTNKLQNAHNLRVGQILRIPSI